ncbi:MAG TPA: S9 family peptidase, partial [Saprospirales bacterium]|nr:S9 family peptidase [Saprospirales bacterium]
MRKFAIAVAIVFWVNALFAQQDTFVIPGWLKLEPAELEYPVFNQAENTRGKIYDDEKLLHFNEWDFSDHFPEDNKQISPESLQERRWKYSMDSLIAPEANFLKPAVVYAATYLWAEEWLKGTIELKSHAMLKVWLDGKEIGTKTKLDEENPGKVSKEVKLERGKHLLLVKILLPVDSLKTWTLSGHFIHKANKKSKVILSFNNSPLDRKNIHHMLDGIKLSDLDLSPDGKYYLVTYRQTLPSSDNSERWTLLKRTDNKQLVHSFRHADIGQIKWLPKTNRISYTATKNKETKIYLLDVENFNISEIFTAPEKFGGYDWSPDENCFIYSVYEEPEKNESSMVQIQGLADRQAWWRNRSFLYSYHLKSGKNQRLTWGNLTTSLHDISPDGSKILFSQSYPDYLERPFSKQNLFMLNLADMHLDTIFLRERWSINPVFSPDGKYLLATGGPSAFNSAGKNTKTDLVTNYDQQSYIYNLENREVIPYTKNFNPSINAVYWHPVDNHIYLDVTEADFKNLYQYDVKKNTFRRIETGVDYMASIDFAPRALVAVYSGNPSNKYPSTYKLNLKNLKYELFEDPEAENFSNVEFGEVKDWNFASTSGVEISGRVYFPPGFDPTRKYPVIVYYYGGITPVSRTFGGRYPFNLWAGHDYIVYVLQPSGAIGFGQDFSTEHMNNWGTTVADEIIEGTKKFLEAHPFANAEKVGCAGASYGGFMTMLLMTRTDIFATAISHAGISSISSYWGEGFWGYAYSAEASADSYPWNNRSLYVDQSPLFNADKIKTPLLLLTGDSDTNVPPGESIQLYTALKILGRPVELVMVKGEDHHILTYNKRIQWHNTIMAWWAKYLKDEGDWWDELFPEG